MINIMTRGSLGILQSAIGLFIHVRLKNILIYGHGCWMPSLESVNSVRLNLGQEAYVPQVL